MNINPIEVLLVEDSMDDAELTIRELKRHNMANNLFHVIDGEQALDFIYSRGQFSHRIDVQQPPKLILLDIKMPKLNGIEVLKNLKENERTKTIPTVILTSSMEDPDIKKCYQLGANSYIVKPVNFERFAEAIKNLGFYWLLLNRPPL
jgi:two-component system response regulator